MPLFTFQQNAPTLQGTPPWCLELQDRLGYPIRRAFQPETSSLLSGLRRFHPQHDTRLCTLGAGEDIAPPLAATRQECQLLPRISKPITSATGNSDEGRRHSGVGQCRTSALFIPAADNQSALSHLPGLCLCGFKPGVFPGVSLLSRRRLSGSPVDGAIGFGPGLIDIT